ncbi:hypothetical protein C8R44DRAFT_807984 [Mycena epipterygia]|nr:hypothetical protein C8R44DRAFT_807984 [Mycena epipterygia]
MNTYLIKRYCELNPALVDMIAYIKQWAKPLGLNSPSSRNKGPITFSSYALVMMSIGFLQHRGLLPNLQEGLPPLKPGILHGTFWLRLPKPLCCDTRYKEKTDWTPPETVPIHELMRDWFKFWALEFNMDEEMMSIRHGGRILRSSLLEEGPFRGVLWNIDPFIRTKNLTQNLDRHSLSRFKLDCYRYSMMPEFELGALPPVLVTASKKKKDKNAPKDADIELAFTRVTEEAEEILDDSARQPWSDDDALPAQTRALSDTPTPTSFSDDAAPAVADSPPAWARPLSDTPSPTSFSDDSAPAVAGLPPTWARPVSDTRTPSDDSAPAVADLPPAWARTLSDTPAPTSDSASTVAGLPPTWTQPLPDTPSMPSFSDDYASAVAGLPAAWTQPLSDTPSPIAFLNNSSVVASDTAGEDVEEDVRIESEESGVEEEERLDYDPAIRLDTYGRIIEPEEPQQVIPEEPEEDLVGWGLKGDPAISSDTYGRGIEAQEEPEQPPKIAVGCALQSS